MSSHGRKSSRGSFSLFSFRSMSQAGSRQAYQNLEEQPQIRSDSSLSYACDPHRQPSGLPGGPLNLSSPSPTSSLRDPTLTRSSTRLISTDTDVNRECRPSTKRTRHLSWLPFSSSSVSRRPTRSSSVQFPTEKSGSTVCPKNISAPTLTSITNPSVARRAGVLQEEVGYPELGVKSSSAGPVEPEKNLENSVGTGRATHIFSRKIDAAIFETELPQPCVETIPKTHSDGFNRLRTSWLKLLHRKEVTHKVLSDARPSSRESPEHKNRSSLEERLTRRHAETSYLCKGKIRNITGQAHIRRRSVNDSRVFYNKILPECRSAQADPPLLHDTDFMGAYLQPLENGSAFSSLTKSFTSALDKLDTEAATPTNMSFIRSKTSFFNLRRNAQEHDPLPFKTPEVAEASSAQASSAVSPFAGSTRGPSDKACQVLGVQTNNRQASQDTPSKYGTAESKTASLGAIYSSGIKRSDPEPLTFTGDRDKPYVPAAPANNYPRGIMALGMHTNTMAFATAPDHIADLAKPQSSSSTGQATESRDNIKANRDRYGQNHLLSSQESRPQRAANKAEENKSVDESIDKGPKGSGLRRGLKKSRSGLGLFTKSKVEISAPCQTAISGDTEQSLPSPQSPILQDRDKNKKVGKMHVKRSRSMHFGGLFGKSKETKTPPPLPETPRQLDLAHQPTTPSPLHRMLRARPDTSSSPRSNAQLVASGPWSSPRRTRDLPDKRKGGLVAQIPGWAGDSLDDDSEDELMEN